MRLQERYTLTMVALVLITGVSLLGILLQRFHSTNEALSETGAAAMEAALREQLEERAVGMTKLLADSLFTAVYQLDADRIDEVTQAILAQKAVLKVHVFDEHGRVLDDGSGSVPETESPPAEWVPTAAIQSTSLYRARFTHPTHGDVLIVVAPISTAEQRFGGIAINLSLTALQEEATTLQDDFRLLTQANQREFLLAGGIAAAALIIVACLLAWRLSKGLISPIRSIANHARQIGEGNYESRIEIDRADELGELANSFEEMRIGLQRQRELEQHALEMETKMEVAEAQNRAKSVFLANMSHEIRTPVSGVLGLTELLGHTTLDERQSRYVENIQRSGNALLSVINDVLDFSKVEEGYLELKVAPFNVTDLVDDIRSLFSHSAAQRGITFSVTVDESLHTEYVGDYARLRQILTNLVGNAIKFTSQGSVSVELSAEPIPQDNRDSSAESTESIQELLRIKVTDTGIGIPAERLEDIFEAFMQVDESSAREFEGTGLGLAITRQLLRLMDGKIRVSSEPGHGSVFELEVPLSVHTPGDYVTIEPVSEPETESPSQVLLVEDHPVNGMLATEMLELIGCHVVLATNGKAALELLEGSQFDLVFMDCHLPGIDGYETTRRIRHESPSTYNRIPVIAMSADAVPGNRERCFDAGMNDFLSKPYRLETLREKVEYWTERQ